jgi:hypothetical protein
VRAPGAGSCWRLVDEVRAGIKLVSIDRFAFIGYRVLDRSQKDKFTPQNKLYPYSEGDNPAPPKVIEASKDYTQSHPRGFVIHDDPGDGPFTVVKDQWPGLLRVWECQQVGDFRVGGQDALARRVVV